MHTYESVERNGLSGDPEKLSASTRSRSSQLEGEETQNDPHTHVCVVCSKRFKRTEHLKRHARSHDPGPYLPCDICERSFLRSDSLRRHKKIHTRAREDEGSECGSSEANSGRQTRPRIFNRACRPCARARVRCDGQYPCERCITTEIECQKVKKKKFTGHLESPASTQSEHVYEGSSQTGGGQTCDPELCDHLSTDTDTASVTSSTLQENDHSIAGETCPTPLHSATWPSTDEELVFWCQPSFADPATMPSLLSTQQPPALPLILDDTAAEHCLMAPPSDGQNFFPGDYWLYPTEIMSHDSDTNLSYPWVVPGSSPNFQPIFT